MDAIAATRPLRLAFLGSPPFAIPILARLLDSPFRPLAVVTAPDKPAGRGRQPQPSPVAELARQAGVELLRPARLRPARGSGDLPPERQRLAALDLDVVLVASYGELLDAAFLALPRRGCLNVHGSLLPRHRGASPVQAAILAGDEITGVSIQRIVLELDAGDLLLSHSLAIGPHETAGELFERLALLGAEAAVQALELVAAGRDRYTPQDASRATHCRKLDKAAGLLDWRRSAAELDRQVRAYTPWPGAHAVLPNGLQATLLAVRPSLEPRALGPGVIEVSGPTSAARLWVGTGAGVLEILELKPAGKRALAAAEFLRGARLESGARLRLPAEAGP